LDGTFGLAAQAARRDPPAACVTLCGLARNSSINGRRLAGKRNAHFSELSGGQRQRLFIALALIKDPQIVFLDEMTTGLDPAARHVAWGLIEAVRARGTTVVLVTHAMEEAERLCDRVAVMEAGRIVTVGTPSGLIAKHTRDVTVRFDTGGHDVPWLSAIPTVAAVSERGGQAAVTGYGPVLVDVAAALAGHGLRAADLRVNQPSLEDVLLQPACRVGRRHLG
jgi:ABC-2 type transport system ATP-binding protein